MIQPYMELVQLSHYLLRGLSDTAQQEDHVQDAVQLLHGVVAVG